jgi:hypothetical protein
MEREKLETKNPETIESESVMRKDALNQFRLAVVLYSRHHGMKDSEEDNFGNAVMEFWTAEDEKGWFHINFLGCPIYDQRYKMVEPFYNGLARVEEFEGKIKRIDITGNTVYDIYIPSEEFRMHRISANLVGFWNTYLAKAFIESVSRQE